MTPRRLKLFVFLGALLLFSQEPLVGKLLLPSSGGSFHVWATCLMFFQGALFAGYLYCHLLAGRLGRWHLALVLAPLTLLPIGRWLQDVHPDPARPELGILLALTTSIGLPFFVLATTGVLAQRWLAESDLPEAKNPYHLFAASNGGSLLALLAYPLLVEPFLGLTAQRYTWSVAYLGYVVLAFVVAPKGSSKDEEPTDKDAKDAKAGDDPAPSWGTYAAWTLLAAAPSACLMAVTNVIAIDLGSAPLVWVIPLSLYLLTFILIFGPRSWYPDLVRRYWFEAVAIGLCLWFLDRRELDWGEGLVHLGVLFVVCLVGHGELYRSRPAPRHLTGFYLTVSLGGWLGGVFVSLVAPHAFFGLAEYPLSVLLLAGTLAIFRRDALLKAVRKSHPLLLAVSGAIVLGTAILVVREAYLVARIPMIVERNVYGIYRVQDLESNPIALDPRHPDVQRKLPLRWLTHGRTVHGKEILLEAAWGQPIGFFHDNAPLGRVVKSRPRPCNAAIVGLGAGALAGHMRAGDRLVYYELDPLVERLARERFHYLSTCDAQVSVVLGDARLNLRDAPDGSYDLILVDAFSSDAIPTHLLTREALELYLKKLRPKGLLAFHVSNNFYDLRPVLKATAATVDPPLVGGFHDKRSRFAPLEDPTTCYLLARDPAVLEPFWKQGFTPAAGSDLPAISPWTDDYANILAALWAGIQHRRRLSK